MKWNKLEYGQWPEGEILVRIEAEYDRICFEVGFISQNIYDKEWYLYINKDFPSIASVDVLCDYNAHYISLDAIEMPEEEELIWRKTKLTIFTPKHWEMPE